MNYQVKRKNIKHMYIRVNDDLDVVVTCGHHFSSVAIDEFVNANQTAINKIIQKKSAMTSIVEYDKIYILGTLYKISYFREKKFRYEIALDQLEIKIFGSADISKLYLRFIKVISLEIFKQIHDELYLEKLDSSFVKTGLEIKTWKNTYGKYYKDANKVVLNYYLIHMPRKYIEHVILHEYCHQRQLNHSSLFYKELDQLEKNHRLNSKYIKNNFHRYL